MLRKGSIVPVIYTTSLFGPKLIRLQTSFYIALQECSKWYGKQLNCRGFENFQVPILRKVRDLNLYENNPLEYMALDFEDGGYPNRALDNEYLPYIYMGI